MSTQPIIPDSLRALLAQNPGPRVVGPPSLDAQMQQINQQQAQNAAMPPPPPVPINTMPQTMAPLPTALAPRVVPLDPSIAATNARALTDQNNLRRLQISGSGIDQITHPIDPTTGLPTTQQPSMLRRFGGVLAKIGNVGADLALGRGAAIIPGTDLHHQMLVNQSTGQVNNDLGDQEKQAQTTLLDAQPELKQLASQNNFLHTLAYIQHVTDQGGHMDNQDAAMYAMHGLKLDPQTGKVVPQSYGEMSEPLQIAEDLKNAQIGIDEAGAAMKRAQIDPSSPAFRAAQQARDTAAGNMKAATVRAQSYYGRYLQSAYNKGLGGDTLPGAPQIEDAGGAVTTVGTGNASHAIKAQANVAKFNDVHGALDNIENSARQLVGSGGSLNSPGVIYAMQHVAGTPSEFVQSLDKANLTPAERQYVISLQAGRENIQALRGAVGSGVSDSQIDRLENMIPSGSTPDLSYLLNQTGQIRQTADRLGKGVTTVSGGTGVRGGNANNGPRGGNIGGTPKEGDVKTNSAGDQIVFHGGRWGLK